MHIFLIKATQLILALAFLIVIHEFGHFLFARIFGVRVDKFYIFFDPFTEIFKWRPKKYMGVFGSHKWLKGASAEERKAYYQRIKDNRTLDEQEEARKKARKNGEPEPEFPPVALTEVWEDFKESPATDDAAKPKKQSFWKNTEYGIGWLPLGGYCKISGMIDESMDTNQMKQPAKPWEFRSKPAWQRLLIMIAGVLFNFLLAILIYAGIVYASGEKYIPFDRAEMGMAYSPAAQEIGFLNGDIPLTADGEKLDYPADAMIKMMQAKVVTVDRQGEHVDIRIPEKFMFTLQDELESGKSPINFLTYNIPTEIQDVTPGEGAARGGIMKGDRIVAIDSVRTPTLLDFQNVITHQAAANKEKNNTKQATLQLTVERTSAAGASEELHLPVTLSEGDKMGVLLQTDVTKFYTPEEKNYSLLASIPRGVEMGTEKLTSYAKSMKLVATKEGAKSIGGFSSIGAIFPEKWDWIAFWNIAAFLSVALAFMNILPIPGLDGGHVLFLIYEIIFRRAPSQKFMEVAQMCGMGFLLLLLLYANGMDIVRLFIK